MELEGEASEEPGFCEVLTVNTTAWNTGGKWLLEQKFDVACVQEITTGQDSVLEVKAGARKAGYRMHIAPSVPGKNKRWTAGAAVLVADH
eukprot:12518046-Alexandrium_andersonii.AAC.1